MKKLPPAAGLWLAAGLLMPALSAQAQTFWQQTPTSPYGSKRELVATSAATLLTTVPGGLLRTTDEGKTWALVCRTGPVYRLLATRAGHLLAGGQGKIYRSFDAGTTWDSVALATSYAVRALAETPAGTLLAGTGDDLPGKPAVGDGVFYSTDKGTKWTPHNSGFGTGRYINQLATDRHGQLYATVSNAWGQHQPGLYVAADTHSRWQSVAVDIRGIGRVQASEITCLFFARCGDWYNSRAGSATSRYGTLVSSNLGHAWRVEDAGLGWSIHGFRNEQFFAELPNGKLFLVQDADEQAYWRQATG
ncbi:MAG TPA: hypothetical protein VFO93_13945 [Hymenobacter sp.]|uniref:WD40/YVTN/BNR-like repeat-containing protein n=1 Tax=Hymenobacter sp. TaxID=1898978 RepID=UPI002D7FA231|nr:hypothetical protein [Hymenobacter sp.]HET9504639.1 hypothetical protein [Hymenobacter sp.]